MPNSLLDGAAFFTSLGLTYEEHKKRALQRAGKLLRDEARSALGTYKYDWPRLQEETIERKATGDSPLLETGELRSSINYTVEGNHVYVGSDDPKALFHEFGTIHIPPRPFLSSALEYRKKQVLKIFGTSLFKHWLGHKTYDDDDWSYDGED